MAIFDSWNMLRKKNPFIGNDVDFIKEFNDTIEVIKNNNLFLSHYFDPPNSIIACFAKTSAAFGSLF